jgi:hypothetical protein
MSNKEDKKKDVNESYAEMISQLKKSINECKQTFQNTLKDMNLQKSIINEKMIQQFILNNIPDINNNLTNNFNIVLSELYESIQNLQNYLNNVLSLFIEQMEDANSLLFKLIEKTKRIDDYIKEKFKENGWLISPSLIDNEKFDIFSLGHYLKENEGKEAEVIAGLFYEIYQENNCEYLKETVNKWYDSLYFKNWKELLNDALYAHTNEKYNLSVPLLLIIAAGIAREFCKDKIGEPNYVRDGENIKKSIEIVQQYNKDLEIFYYLDLFEEIIDKYIYGSTDNSKTKEFSEKDILNRHVIFHGLNKNFGIWDNSLRGFLLLDWLSLLR